MPELCTPWITGEDLFDAYSPDTCNAALADIPEATLDNAAYLSSAVLFRLTGETLTGACEAIVRPCARRCHGSGPAWGPGVTRPNHSWRWDWSWGSCSCSGDCGCPGLDRITLGVYPIISIDEVWVNGVQLVDGVDYALVEDRWLERAPGKSWPACSDVWAPETDPDTFVVHVTGGEEPPADGIIAAEIYGAELALGMCGLECNLPGRVASIVRQGVTVSFESAADLARDGRTGVAVVDTWLGAYNGGVAHRSAPATITSPDIGRAVRHIL